MSKKLQIATKRLCFSCVALIALTGAGTTLRAQTSSFTYVANGNSNNVSAYSVNGTTGALMPVANSPFPAGNFPTSVTVDPTGQFAYVTNFGSDNVSAYTIDATTGALTPVAGSPFPAGTSPHSVTVDPTGQFAYVANRNSANVSAYTIDATTGALTPVAGSPFPAGPRNHSVTVDPTGQFTYVASGVSNKVWAYTIDRPTGTLTPVAGSPFPAGGEPISVTVDSTGQFVYVANQGGNVSAYTIDGTTGALTPIGGSPFRAGDNPRSVMVDPTGQFAYVANCGETCFGGVGSSGDVSAYTIDGTTGALTPVVGSPFSAGLLPRSVAADPTGQFAYVANFSSNNVSAFTIDGTTGALMPAGSFPAGSGLMSVTTTAGPPPPTIASVFPGDPDWFAFTPGSSSVQITAANPRAGDGSLEFAGTGGAAFINEGLSPGFGTFGDLNRISFEWFIDPANTSAFPPDFALRVYDFGDPRTFFLHWDPCRALDGCLRPTGSWQSTNLIGVLAIQPGEGNPPPPSLKDIPLDAPIVGIHIRAGYSPGSPWHGFVDNVTIGFRPLPPTTFNFEVPAP